jgi:hypothetical protein
MRLDASLPAVSREPGPHVGRPCDTISGDTNLIRLRRFVTRNALDFDQIVLRERADKSIFFPGWLCSRFCHRPIGARVGCRTRTLWDSSWLFLTRHPAAWSCR